MQNLKSKVANLKPSVYLMILVLSIFAMLLRVDSLSFFNGSCLWGEDGNIFLNQAFTLGIESFWTPYAGYLHLYPRIFAFIASNIDLLYAPYIFTLGWLIAFLLMELVIIQEFAKLNIHWIFSFIVILTIDLQPHSGETFFNITNAHWFLAISLAVLLILHEKTKPSIQNLFILVLLGLTGPFSIIILPILLAKIIIKKDFLKNWFAYVVIFAAAGIQIFFMLHSDRLSGRIDTNIINWFKSFYIFITFGGKGLVSILGLLFWSIFFMFTTKAIIDKKVNNNFINAALLLFAAGVFYFAGLWSAKSGPSMLNPMGAGARYFVLPYALILITLPILIISKRILSLLLFLFFLIASAQFTKINRPDLNFQSYAWMSKHVKNINIPINPQWETYPGWHISKISEQVNNAPISIDIHHVQIINLTMLDSFKKFKSITNDSQIIFDMPKECVDSNYIGLEVDIIRENDGWANIYWTNKNSDFTEVQSHKRFYLAGKNKMQFAFENHTNFNKLRFDPSENIENIEINNLVLYCGEK